MNEDMMGSRREFLKGVGLSGLLAAGLAGCEDGSQDFVNTNNFNQVVNPGTARVQSAIDFRTSRAQQANANPAVHQNNGDEGRYSNFIASFSKTLPHNDLGEVDVPAFQAFVNAIDTFDPAAMENVPRGGTAQFVNPFAGQAFTLSGVDGQSVTMPPAPTFDSATTAAEMVDLYWMALCRDVPFTNFGVDATVGAAVGELNTLADYRPGTVTPATLFRGLLPGDNNGPYISQFLWKTVPFGAYNYEQMFAPNQPGIDLMTSQVDTVNVQRGIDVGNQTFSNTARYISTFRDLASFVHVDALHQSYLQAALILLAQGTPFDSGFPFNQFTRGAGFATFGAAQVLGLVTEVSVRALKAAWYQKWNVHRRLRPEVFGLRAHCHMTNQANYPIHPQLLNSNALTQTFNQQGTYLLSQAYPEGSPAHPSYGAGHAAVAGACTTVLKALFDGQSQVINTVEADQTGSALNVINGNFTVNGELNKLCSNISIGRNAAGVHYITDYIDCITIGEEVGISILLDALAASEVFGELTLERFDGSVVTLTA
jgi:membrane-associated phospholipid phosphatase